jgi:hypothetical protein
MVTASERAAIVFSLSGGNAKLEPVHANVNYKKRKEIVGRGRDSNEI